MVRPICHVSNLSSKFTDVITQASPAVKQRPVQKQKNTKTSHGY